jgi:RNA-directed DNA polymerase
VLEPIFEADFEPCSFGFRPQRAAHDALQLILDECARGRRWVVETDIADCFEAIPHEQLMQAIEERIVDRQLLKLLRALLRAGVMEEGAVRRSVSGTPQGGVVSPLLCNVYLHRLDRAWRTRGVGVLVRYADDLVVMCRTESEARRALVALRTLLSELGLEPKQAKTRIMPLREGGEGFDFLGFHHRYVRGRTRRSRNITFLARWPSHQAMQHARDRIRELTARERLLLSVDDVVQDVNRFLRGWAGYFRYGNSARPFDKIQTYALARLSLFVAKRRRKPRSYGWRMVAYESPTRMGLINLNGRVVAPRPNRPWREKPNAGGERRR